MASSISGGKSIIRDGLVFYIDAANPRSYPYTSSGPLWKDLSKNLYDGANSLSPTYSSTYQGNISYNGTSNYTTFPTNIGVNGLATATFCFWIYIYTNQTIPFINRYDTNSGSLNVDFIGTQPGTTKPFARCLLGTLNNRTDWISNSELVNLNTWNHVVFTINNPSSSVSLYFNNQSKDLTATTVGTGAGSTINVSSTTPWTLARGVGVSGSPVYSQITISNIAVYNRVLTVDEIDQNYNVGRYRFGL